MGRLVDIDEVIRVAENTFPQEDVRKIAWVLCYTPTAYDVEKVVEELACNSRFIDDINEHNFKCISCVIGQKKAIDIVKRGGADGNI